ncbi:Nodulation-signaling pathway 1 protein [Acorus calamus]|uniref:Nodulation-signaling pathway 1 protein n=1 Tax=Acorus calamus TaxID=4465 RepID=A0AAV9CIM0_ACOCL|nr:Nodulation-signaling pathway 1 protein [Acorus calamus]
MATRGEPDPNTSAILDWLDDSISFIPPFLRDPYESSAIDEIDCQLWDPFQEQNHNHLNNIPNTTTITPTNSTPQPSPPLPTPPSEQQSKLSKKRKQNQPNTQTTNSSDGDNTEEIKEIKRKPKKPNSKASNGVGNCGNGCGTNKDSRWAEQLLLPCATAIDAGDLSRVQHLLFVLHEVASPSGDANHRLAWHGLQSLTHHLALNTVTAKTASASTFASMDPSAFRAAIFKFNEVSPWFAFPNSLANSAILQTLGGGDLQRRSLHIVDIGVSHGVQWPTLLEALTRRPGGPPLLVRLTIVSAAPTEPFAAAPAGYDSSSHLIRYAKSIDLNLEISRIDTLPSTLDRETLATSADETLIVCAQFRLRHLSHFPDDERTAFLQSVADLSPRLVVVSENDGDCGGSGCGCGGGGFARGFGARTEYIGFCSGYGCFAGVFGGVLPD